MVKISTSLGEMNAILYDKTPKHKANFLKLIDQKFYQDLLFHRVIDQFMIQGGDPNSKNAKPEDRLGSGGDNLQRIPAEFNASLFHKKGALAAARDDNAQKASSNCQFYIVEGKPFSAEDLAKMAIRNGMTYTDQQINTYKSTGGTPHLDNNYTVYGEIISGFEVLEKISNVKTGPANRPSEDVRFSITSKKTRKKAITKKYGYKYQ